MKVTSIACEAMAKAFESGDRDKVIEFINSLPPIQAAYVAARTLDYLGSESIYYGTFLKRLHKESDAVSKENE